VTELRVGKVRLVGACDPVVGKAMAEAAREEVAALFQAGGRRRMFRLVTGAPAERGIEVSGAFLEIAIGEPRENAAMLTFTLNRQADGVRRWMSAAAVADGSARIDTARNPVPQAVRILRDLVSRRLDRIAEACARAVEDAQRRR
jgi:hypothetical protein